MDPSMISPSMLSMYHAGLRIPPGAGLFPQFRPQISHPLWPHAPTSFSSHSVQSLSHPYSGLNLQKPTEDSCGGSSASNASDTNGSGDEVRKNFDFGLKI